MLALLDAFDSPLASSVLMQAFMQCKCNSCARQIQMDLLLLTTDSNLQKEFA